MKKVILTRYFWLVGVLLGCLASRAQAQPLTFDRAVTCASGDGNYGYFSWGPRQVVADAQGNTYVHGIFNGTVVLGTALLTATQTYPGYRMPSDNFVAKLDAAGNYVWAVQMGDNQAAGIGGLTVDAVGDVYLTGAFTSYSMRFGNSGQVLYNSSAQSEGFIAKLSGATGQWLWSRRIGGTGDDNLRSMAVNAAGNLYVLGSSSGTTADVGPFSLSGPQTFLAQITPAGVWQWVRPLGNEKLVVSSLLLDAQGDVYLGGTFPSPSATFGATTLTTQTVPGAPTLNARDVFVAKMTAAGTWLWAVQGDAVTHQNMVQGGGLALDGQGHLYTAGNYAGTAARFGTAVLPNLSGQYPQPNPLPVTPYTNYRYTDAFVARLSAATGAWEWAVRNGGANIEDAYTPLVDARGQLYVPGVFNSPTLAYDALQLAQLDAATGNWGRIYSLAPLYTCSVVLDGQNRLTIAGYFSGATATLGAFTLAQDGPGRDTGFLARIGLIPLANQAAKQLPTALQVWPNPSGGGTVWVQGVPAGQGVEVLDVLGRVVQRGQMPARGPLRLALGPATTAGVYVVRGGGQARRLVIE